MKSRLFYILSTLGMISTLCLHTTTAEAVFASVKSIGMAGTAISYPLDTLAGAYNVAGLADVGDRFDVEVGYVHDTGSAEVTAFDPLTDNFVTTNFQGMRTKSVVPVNVGFNKDWILCGDECFADWRLSTGLIIYNRSYQKTTYTQPMPLLGTTKAGLELLNETIAAIVGIQWCEAHTVAVSFDYQVQRLKVDGLENFDNPFLSVSPGNVTNRGYNYSNGCGVSVGYLGHLTDCLSVGVNYSPRVSMSRFDKYKGFLVHGRLDVPRRIGVGISYKILPCLVIAFDAEQLEWSKVRSLHNPLLHDGVVLPLGSSDGPGFGFRDAWYYRTGIEWGINESWTVRLGYRYANTPIRSSQTAVNVLTLDTVQSYVTAGGTWNLNECNEISICGAYGFENKIKGPGAIPEFIGPIPTGGGDVNIKEQKWVIGLAWGYKF